MKTNSYKVIGVLDKRHVVKSAEKRPEGVPTGNYLGMGLVLCELLRENEILDDGLKIYFYD